jgi:hypothetical protein
VIAALIFFVLVLLLTGGGIALLMRAQARERHEQMQLRLRMLGSDEAAAQALEGFRPLSPQLANPLVRAVSHLLWRTGVEVEAATVQNALLLSLLIVPVSMVLFGLVGGLLMLAVVCALIWGVLARQAAGAAAAVPGERHAGAVGRQHA